VRERTGARVRPCRGQRLHPPQGLEGRAVQYRPRRDVPEGRDPEAFPHNAVGEEGVG